MKECEICHKKMPGRVLEAHKVKRHSASEIQTKIEVNEKELAILTQISTEKQKEEGTLYYQCNCPCQKLETCVSCGETFSAIVMFAHGKIRHGV